VLRDTEAYKLIVSTVRFFSRGITIVIILASFWGYITENDDLVLYAASWTPFLLGFIGMAALIAAIADNRYKRANAEPQQQ
jgi:hypothetical protein